MAQAPDLAAQGSDGFRPSEEVALIHVQGRSARFGLPWGRSCTDTTSVKGYDTVGEAIAVPDEMWFLPAASEPH